MTLWTVAHQAPPPMGFSRQEYWSRLSCSPTGDLLNPGTKPASHVSCIGKRFFTTELPGEPPSTQVAAGKGMLSQASCWPSCSPPIVPPSPLRVAPVVCTRGSLDPLAAVGRHPAGVREQEENGAVAFLSLVPSLCWLYLSLKGQSCYPVHTAPSITQLDPYSFL